LRRRFRGSAACWLLALRSRPAEDWWPDRRYPRALSCCRRAPLCAHRRLSIVTRCAPCLLSAVPVCMCHCTHILSSFYPICNKQVCYDCLRVFEPAQQPLQIAGQAYCQQQCAERAGGTYAAVEGPSNSNFAALSQYCGTYRERFPLLAARLACSIVQSGHSPAFEVVPSRLSTCLAACPELECIEPLGNPTSAMHCKPGSSTVLHQPVKTEVSCRAGHAGTMLCQCARPAAAAMGGGARPDTGGAAGAL
jgi:hypothetical protein